MGSHQKTFAVIRFRESSSLNGFDNLTLSGQYLKGYYPNAYGSSVGYAARRQFSYFRISEIAPAVLLVCINR